MLKILIVDDEAPVREWLIYCLKSYKDKFEIVGVVNNGKEGLISMKETHPDVVITDISMPEMDGLTFMETAGKSGYVATFIILTNHEDFSFAKRAIQCGAKQYLLKTEMKSKELIDILECCYAEKYKQDPAAGGSDIVQKALVYIHENYANSITLNDMAKHLFLSSEYFSRLFKEKVGENFSTYLMRYRLEIAQRMLISTNDAISEVAKAVGYPNASYFSKIYKRNLGNTPESERMSKRNMSKM